MNMQPGPMEFLAAFAIVLGTGLLAGFALGWWRKPCPTAH